MPFSPVLRRSSVPLLAVALGIALAAPSQSSLLDEGACDSWATPGGPSGSDLRLALCRDGSFVTGTLHWNGGNGQSESQVGGVLDGNRVHLVEQAATLDRPRVGWRFCFDAVYDLEAHGDVLEGRYRSAACEDRGTLRLRRLSLPEAFLPRP